MRILITGGCGFIGSFVAERCYAEGHDICILDNLSAGDRRNVGIPHKFFKLDAEDENCREVFETGKFDAVIHLAARTGDAGDLEGLVNMLRLSARYGVKKFVYASSAEVYGPGGPNPYREDDPAKPESLNGVTKRSGEMYCRNWEETHGLATLCFRISDVYGPRQRVDGEGGWIRRCIEDFMKGRATADDGTVGGMRNCIYVEDVADAICRAVEYDLGGLYNLSGNTAASVEDIIRLAKAKLGGAGSDCGQEPASGSGMLLDNALIKKELDWVPLHTLEEGLEKTIDWLAETIRKGEADGRRRRRSPGWPPALRRAVPYAENLALLALGMFMDIALEQALGMVDFILVYVLAASFLLGRSQSILSIAAASVWFVSARLSEGREPVSLIADYNTFAYLSFYIFVGLAVGYLLDKKDVELAEAKAELEDVKNRNEFLYEVYQDTREVKDSLQDQILQAEAGLGAFYRTCREFDSDDPATLYRKAAEVTADLMRTPKVAVYVMDHRHGKLVLVEATEDGGWGPPRDVRPGDYMVVEEALAAGKVATNRHLADGEPSMTAPLCKDNTLFGAICLYGMDFESLTLHKQNLFGMVAGLASLALARADHRRLAPPVSEGQGVLYA